jgi:hypothetical protein
MGCYVVELGRFMSQRQIEEAFTIAWSALAIASWGIGAPNAVTLYAALSAGCSLISCWVYGWKERNKKHDL